MSRENEEVVHRIAAALGPRDLSTFLEVTAPDVEWHASLSVISEGGAYHGHEGVRQYVKDVAEAFETFEATLDGVLSVGDLVLGVGQVTFRGKASGVEQTQQFGWVFRFRGGRVVYLRAFRDPEQALEAVGLTE
jgi:ketosteroid isomerase-like protein